ncbi:response regulator transcription factor [Virgibacillus halodenitrificans]|uniref:Response regulator transcription factor n=1 Tax=Virgibacillus halodenitrificans TaxID=1482 RepID=A0ABR7VKN4_VIRHA|nr:response regulator transcription factor [Virgibacillus halodenitrificans]MBD1221062.1 response regulator transcription factor [Virgibacillus halodenitrificans]MYL46472.1 hypothetical protein [Virgibacillus halodenitrificans]MYL59489.1 hypothetical protein [Virgibacillus halodenitrificans]
MNILYVSNTIFPHEIIKVLEDNPLVDLVKFTGIKQPNNEELRVFQPALMLLDMEGLHFQEAGKIIQEAKNYWKDMRTFLLTSPFSQDDLHDILLIDTDSILVKMDTTAETINEAITTNQPDQFIFPAGFTKNLIDLLEETEEYNIELFQYRLYAHQFELSKRQSEVAYLLKKGLRNKEIAELLQLSEGTVKIHVSQIYQKINLKGRKRVTLFLNEMMIKEREV